MSPRLLPGIRLLAVDSRTRTISERANAKNPLRHRKSSSALTQDKNAFLSILIEPELQLTAKV